MAFKWAIYVVVFYISNFLGILRHHVHNFSRGMFMGMVDFYNEAQTKYVYLRPRDIRYNSDFISKDMGSTWDGTSPSIFDELRESLYRFKAADEISCDVVVIRRKGSRGSESRPTGWWVVHGNERLWVLKRLEDVGIVTFTKFKAIQTMSDPIWNSVCRVTQLSNWGEEAIAGSNSGSEKAELEMEFKKVIEEYRHYLAPKWSKVVGSSEGTNSLRLADYEKEKAPRNTTSCGGGRLCHMVKKDYIRQKVHYNSEARLISLETFVCLFVAFVVFVDYYVHLHEAFYKTPLRRLH